MLLHWPVLLSAYPLAKRSTPKVRSCTLFSICPHPYLNLMKLITREYATKQRYLLQELMRYSSEMSLPIRL